jgi:hypothetical protein
LGVGVGGKEKVKNAQLSKRVHLFDWPEVCVQSQFALRDADFDADFAADLIVRLLSGEDVSDVFPEQRQITRFERCHDCAVSVLSGGAPIPTDEGYAAAISAGRRSQTRRRRARRSG